MIYHVQVILNNLKGVYNMGDYLILKALGLILGLAALYFLLRSLKKVQRKK